MEQSKPKLILASASPRRLDLLRQVGVEPDTVIPAELDEAPLRGELPAPYVRRIAEAKARQVAAANDGAFVLAADTTVACGRRILAKPADSEAARRGLELLSGRRHRVHGGISLVSPAGIMRTRHVVTQVAFKRLSGAEIAAYVESGEWQGKAGGYAIQGRAGAFVRAIHGCYFNVVGLSLIAALSLLQGAGWRNSNAG